jgi:hypothetical protein
MKPWAYPYMARSTVNATINQSTNVIDGRLFGAVFYRSV